MAGWSCLVFALALHAAGAAPGQLWQHELTEGSFLQTESREVPEEPAAAASMEGGADGGAANPMQQMLAALGRGGLGGGAGAEGAPANGDPGAMSAVTSMMQALGGAMGGSGGATEGAASKMTELMGQLGQLQQRMGPQASPPLAPTPFTHPRTAGANAPVPRRRRPRLWARATRPTPPNRRAET